MDEQPPKLPPSLEDIDSALLEGAEVTPAEYAGRWERASELLNYLKKVPEKLTDKMDMTARKEKLVSAFDQLVSPKHAADPIQGESVRRINSWIENAEGFIGFLLQSYEPAASTVQQPILVSSIEEDEDWQWPWIEGWEDPKKRKKILNPPKTSDSQMKKLLIGGAVIGGAFYLGKRVMGD